MVYFLFLFFQGFFVALFYCFLNGEVCFATNWFFFLFIQVLYCNLKTKKIHVFEILAIDLKKKTNNNFSPSFFLISGEICTKEEVQHSSRKSHAGHKMYENFHWLGQWHYDTERPRGPHQWQPPRECVQLQWSTGTQDFWLLQQGGWAGIRENVVNCLEYLFLFKYFCFHSITEDVKLIITLA